MLAHTPHYALLQRCFTAFALSRAKLKRDCDQIFSRNIGTKIITNQRALRRREIRIVRTQALCASQNEASSSYTWPPPPLSYLQLYHICASHRKSHRHNSLATNESSQLSAHNEQLPTRCLITQEERACLYHPLGSTFQFHRPRARLQPPRSWL